jgi:hypothetical protein
MLIMLFLVHGYSGPVIFLMTGLRSIKNIFRRRRLVRYFMLSNARLYPSMNAMSYLSAHEERLICRFIWCGVSLFIPRKIAQENCANSIRRKSHS